MKKSRLIIILSFVCSFLVVLEAAKCNLKTSFLCDDGKTCIQKAYRCNGIADCPTKEDEKDCDIEKCEDKEKFFLCRDKINCISRNLICDNEGDCPDYSDESDELCSNVAAVISKNQERSEKVCNPKTEFKCGNNVCIPNEDVCDGYKNCQDGSDEQNCDFEDKYTCIGFLCANKKCLPTSLYVCDGQDDCGDNSDEEHCYAKCDARHGKFLCKSGDECIDIKKVCNNIFDCSDKSDENANCDIARNATSSNSTSSQCEKLNCPKKSECVLLPGGPTCFCKNGYDLNKTSNACEDIDECQIFGTCSQGCKNKEGSYECTCAKGFILNEDNMSCDTTSVNASIIYTTKNNIKRITFGQRGNTYHEVIAKTKQSVGVTYDGEYYYWVEVQMAREVIVKYSPATKTKEVLLTNGLELPEYIAVDWLTKNIYFTDSTRRHVAVCTNDGYHCTELVKIDIMHYPRSIALHPQDGLLFWTDWGNNSHIGVSFMDGSNPKVLVDDVDWPNGLAIDWPNSRIYWIDALSSKIESVRITGDDRQVVLKGIFKHPFALDVFGDKLYWSDHGTKSIEYCDKFTGKNHDVLLQGEEIFDVHVFDSSAMPITRHGCEDNPCSHICLLRGNGNYSCSCPIGMELNSDQHNCRFNSKSFFIQIGVGKNIYSKVFQSFGRSIENSVKHAEVMIHTMEYNSLNGEIFYANSEEHKLYILDAIGNSRLLLEDPNLRISSMSFDYFGNNLYFADTIKETIEVISLTTKRRTIIHSYTQEFAPISIAVVPSIGEIFVALQSQGSSKITRESMKGSDLDDTSLHLVSRSLGNGSIYLIVDEEEEKLYWSDTQKNRIEFSNFDGTKRKIFIQSERAPGPMTLVDNYLHWTSESSKSMQWRKKNGTGPIKLIRLSSLQTMDKDKKDEFPRVLPIVTSKPLKMKKHICTIDNGGCTDICVPNGPDAKICLCALGRVLMEKSQTKCIDRTNCVARCATGECIESSMMCDGRIDCLDRSDEDNPKCKPHLNVSDSSSDDGSSSGFWIIFLIFLVLMLFGTAIFVYYKKKGFNAFHEFTSTAANRDISSCCFTCTDFFLGHINLASFKIWLQINFLGQKNLA